MVRDKISKQRGNINFQTIIQLIEKCCQENEKNNRTRTEILIEKGEISEE